jgi:hypothetical protein
LGGRRWAITCQIEALGNKLVFHLGKRVLPAEAPELMDQSLQIMKLLARKS